MARIGQKMRHMRSKAADCTFFDCEKCLVLTSHTRNQLTIQRLHEARVDNACAPAFGIQPFGGLHGLFQPRAIAQQTYTATFTDDAALANFQRRAARGQSQSDSFATRIAHS